MTISVKTDWIKHMTVPEPVGVSVTADTLSVDLDDGRTIQVPTLWYPRLAHGSPEEWGNYELSPFGIHWPDLNEDVSVEALLLGEKSGESQASLGKWLAQREQGEKPWLKADYKAWQQ